MSAGELDEIAESRPLPPDLSLLAILEQLHTDLQLQLRQFEDSLYYLDKETGQPWNWPWPRPQVQVPPPSPTRGPAGPARFYSPFSYS